MRLFRGFRGYPPKGGDRTVVGAEVGDFGAAWTEGFGETVGFREKGLQGKELRGFRTRYVCCGDQEEDEPDNSA